MSRASPDLPPAPPHHTLYPVKWALDHRQSSFPICMQNHNGPCAILALTNALLTTRKASLTPGTTSIREDYLMNLLVDYISTNKAQPSSPATSSGASPSDAAAYNNYALEDFLDLLPTLNRGMDVNVRFTGTTAFEFTRELSVFDVLRTRLLHGWLVDPQDVRLSVAIGNLSYNQLLDELVRTEDTGGLVENAAPSAPPAEALAPPPEAFVPFPYPSATSSNPSYSSAPSPNPFDPSDPSDPSVPPPPQALSSHSLEPQLPAHDHPPPAALHVPPVESVETVNIRETRPLIVDFLETNATQLTFYGLAELHATVREDETAVLFRNSHFHVLTKRGGNLYTLVTDAGFQNELNVVWEGLSDITGDSSFFDGAFQRLSNDGTIVANADAAAARPPSANAPERRSRLDAGGRMDGSRAHGGKGRQGGVSGAAAGRAAGRKRGNCAIC